jgi:zinc D-Ala-D-Ala carboxypeptidase
MRYFKDHEFLCRCGHCGMGIDEMDGSLLAKLDSAREVAGIPFVISSAVRCQAHNADINGAKRSAHLTGHAVDISCVSDMDRWTIVQAAVLCGFTRIGIASGFIHLDTAPYLNKNRIWMY